MSHSVTSKSLVPSSLHFHSSIYIPWSPWAFSSQDSSVQGLSDFPCMRGVSPPKSPPWLFCGFGMVCACLFCSRKHKPGPRTQDAFHQYQSPSCPNMFGSGFQNNLLHYTLRSWSKVDGHVVSAILMFFSYASSYILKAAPKDLRYIPFLQLKHKYR